ncbi:unnamed protein product [Prunus armeniaca]
MRNELEGVYLLVTNFGIGGSTIGTTPVLKTSHAVSVFSSDPASTLATGCHGKKAPSVHDHQHTCRNKGRSAEPFCQKLQSNGRPSNTCPRDRALLHRPAPYRFHHPPTPPEDQLNRRGTESVPDTNLGKDPARTTHRPDLNLQTREGCPTTPDIVLHGSGGSCHPHTHLSIGIRMQGPTDGRQCLMFPSTLAGAALN